MNDKAVISISAGALHLEIAPSIGGSIARFYSKEKGPSVEWLRPASAEGLAQGNPQMMSSFPLVPFSGRVRDGRFVFGGRHISLVHNFGNSPHAIHGNAWKLPWKITAHDAASASLVLEHERGDWPFAYRAEQHFVLTPRSLEIELLISNTDAAAMPVGIGHHPYFPYTESMTLQAEVSQMWESEHDMPVRLTRNDTVESLARGLKMASVKLDNNFIGWKHAATLRWPETGRRLRMTAQTPLSYLVVFTPPSRDFLCVEPVSNTVDWLNLGDLPAEQIGGAILSPGASISGRVRFEPDFG
ncbi:MAG: aldose 1-epimerase [Betaproteobacteria bacterium]|jgi:aldose 1-epimerase